MNQENETSSPLKPTNEHSSTIDQRMVASIYRALMLVVFSVGGIWLLVELQPLLVLLFVALLIATSLAGPVRRLEKWKVPRAIAILLMFVAVLGLVIGIIWFAIPPLIGQIAATADSIPDRIAQFDRLQERYVELESQYPVLMGFEDRAVESLSDLVTSVSQGILALPAMITLAIFVVTSLMTLSFLMLMSWSSMKPVILRIIHPDNQAVTDHVLATAGRRLGAYVRAKAIISTIVAIWMYVTLMLLGSPITLLVAILAGLFEIIPRIGPLIARAFVVVAVLPLGWRAVLIAFISHMVIDNIKGSWLSPIIEGNQVDIHPLTAIIAVLAGAYLMGWMGALIAVPLAAVIQVLVEEVVMPWRLRQLGMVERVPVISDLDARRPVIENQGE